MGVKGSLRSGLPVIRTDLLLSRGCHPDCLRTMRINDNHQGANLTCQRNGFGSSRQASAVAVQAPASAYKEGVPLLLSLTSLNVV